VQLADAAPEAKTRRTRTASCVTCCHRVRVSRWKRRRTALTPGFCAICQHGLKAALERKIGLKRGPERTCGGGTIYDAHVNI